MSGRRSVQSMPDNVDLAQAITVLWRWVLELDPSPSLTIESCFTPDDDQAAAAAVWALALTGFPAAAKPGHICTSCGSSVEGCDAHIRQSGRGCCAICYRTDTHGLLLAGTKGDQ